MKSVRYKAGMFLALAVAILIVAAVYRLAADRARQHSCGRCQARPRRRSHSGSCATGRATCVSCARNFADRLVLGVLDQAAVVPATSAAAPDPALPQQVDAYERMLIADALAASDDNVTATADRLGVPKKPCTTS